MKKELLTVSFGTSFRETRDATIGEIEKALGKAFPDYEVKRAFTSGMVIKSVQKKDGIKIMNVQEAMEDALACGVTEILIQPTHLMDGREFSKVKTAAEQYKSRFEKLTLSKPMLMEEQDYEELAAAVVKRTAEYDDGKTAICFMGHGTDVEANKAYTILQGILDKKGFSNYFISTVESVPSFEDTVKQVTAKGCYEKAVLLPLMVVAGDHANNDMAGSEEDTWKSMFENTGISVNCILEGLGQYEDVRKIYVRHAGEALKKQA